MALFNCQMCGKCCSGKGGIIVSPKDLRRLSTYFNCSDEEFVVKYTYQNNGKIKILATNDYCIFFDPKKACTIHQARPNICRAWPYFRGNIVDESSFLLAKEDCLGIERNAKHEEFVKEAIDYLLNNDLIAHDKKNEANALIIDTQTIAQSLILKAKNDN